MHSDTLDFHGHDLLSVEQRLNAQLLDFSVYSGMYGAYGYDNAALYTTSYGGAGTDALFGFYATQGAVYSIVSESYTDPDELLVFDAAGYPILVDDGFGEYGIDHVVFVAPYTGIYYVDAAWTQDVYFTSRPAALTILEDRGTLAMAVIGGTNGPDVIDGTIDDDDLYGFGGSDSLYGGPGDDYLDGGAGIDSAYYIGRRADYELSLLFDRVAVEALAYQGGVDEGIDMLSNVERLDFSDLTVGLDLHGPSGQAFRLYQAAFDRAPDLEGLGYWIAQLDHGASLEGVAQSFVNSPEFRYLYGDFADHYHVVVQLYDNVLHRAIDQAGLHFWVNALDSRQATLPEVLVAFSESAENFAQLAGVTSEGISFLPWA
jgi:serralysin